MSIPAVSSIETEAARTRRHVLSVIVRDPLSLASVIIITVFILLAVFADLIAPYPEQGAGKTNASNTMAPPSSANLFGADKLGRDVLSRVIVGARSALLIPIFVVLRCCCVPAGRSGT
jgi:peptide/nickel transport system permease protein